MYDIRTYKPTLISNLESTAKAVEVYRERNIPQLTSVGWVEYNGGGKAIEDLPRRNLRFLLELFGDLLLDFLCDFFFFFLFFCELSLSSLNSHSSSLLLPPNPVRHVNYKFFKIIKPALSNAFNAPE